MGALRKAGVWLGFVEDEQRPADPHSGDAFFDDEFVDDDGEYVPPAGPRTLARSGRGELRHAGRGPDLRHDPRHDPRRDERDEFRRDPRADARYGPTRSGLSGSADRLRDEEDFRPGQPLRSVGGDRTGDRGSSRGRGEQRGGDPRVTDQRGGDPRGGDHTSERATVHPIARSGGASAQSPSWPTGTPPAPRGAGPMSGAPVSGLPMSGPPVSGAPASPGGRPHGALGYSTRENLALAPQMYLSERALTPDEPIRRYEITTLHPTSYSEARSIGEHFRDGHPVIMNLTDLAEADAKRLVDFAAGLAFGLRGSIERLTNRVFLLSPPNIQVTAEDRARITGGGFFDQA